MQQGRQPCLIDTKSVHFTANIYHKNANNCYLFI